MQYRCELFRESLRWLIVTRRDQMRRMRQAGSRRIACEYMLKGELESVRYVI